ncbi:SDR family NAD(P)-dependent oxidoreductase [Aureivirga sp. CE67]|uniref:SDR family NAD(P)-dependent oxidoreductase n=1 Tax=Aureivirga sp. CE67 TaxID=1788983 RepID=UPI0018CB1864|nr:SDR family NAD(P)-dependent oxidoreductase [Aureivirga sp. CE67]
MKTPTNEKFAVVTGASQGLGKEFCIELAKRKNNLILISLPNQNLNKLSKEISRKYNVETVCFETDLSCDDNLKELTNHINHNYEINILINNAGIGGTRNFEKVDMDYINKIIQVNVKATSILTHQLLPNLKKQSDAYILNVSSMAAHTPIGYKTVYPASKSFIHSFSLGLASELKNTSVSVSVVNPGAMKTNPDVTLRTEKQGFFGKITLLEPQKVAKYSIKQLLKKERLIVVNPLMWFLTILLPSRIKVPIMTRILKREVSDA